MATTTWLEYFDAGRQLRLRFKFGLVVYTLGDWIFWLWAVHNGHRWLAFLAELLASALALMIIGWLWEEGGSLRYFRRLNPKIQSWAFLGDWVGLAPMGFIAALAWPNLPHDRWFNSGITGLAWDVLPLLIGVGFAYTFRKGEGDAYDVLRYFSLTKMVHNGVAFTVLTAMIIHAMIPIWFWGDWGGGLPEAATAFFLIWLAGAIADGLRDALAKRSPNHPLGLKHFNLHPQTDGRGRAIYPEIEGVPTWNEHKKLNPGVSFNILQVRKWPTLVAVIFGRKRQPGWMPADQVPDQVPPDREQQLGSQDFTDDDPNRPG